MKKKALIVTYRYPASDRRSWSGTSYSLRQELEKEFDVFDYCIDPKRSLFALLKTFYYRKIKKSFVTIQLLKSVAKTSSKAVGRIAREKNCDCIVVLGALACGAVAYNRSGIPIVWVSDCVISQNYDYYWNNIDIHMIKEFDYVQQRALNN